MKIQIIKLKKSEYANLPALLKRAGLVKEQQAYPSNLFVSKKTYMAIKAAIMVQLKKQYPYINRKKLKLTAGMELLNLGPVVIDKGIEMGYAVVVPLELE